MLKKGYKFDLKELRSIFLSYRYDNYPYFITLISKADLERMLLFTKSLEVKSLNFYDSCRRGLAFIKIIHLLK
jgi:hypothetical protein